MQLGQLEALVAVARHGNVRRAARELSVTQPSLSARLHGLEQSLGEKLLVRGAHGVRLTDAGRVFLPFAERALRTLDEGDHAIRGLRDASSGRLALGAAPAISTYLLPAVLRRYAEQFPQVEIVVRTGHSEEVLSLVLREEVQLGLVRALTHPEICALPIHEDELVLVAGPNHPFRARSVSIEEV